MKKLLLISFVVVVLAATAQAQDFGVQVGANFANVSGDDTFDQTDSKFNFTFGVFGEFKMADKFGIQPELIFSGQGFKYKADDGNGNTIEFKQKMSYVNVPVLGNYYLSDNFYLQGGPYLGFLTSAEVNVSGTLGLSSQFGLGDGDNKDAYKSTDFGAMVGLGMTSGRIILGLRYQLGLANVSDVDGADAKHRVLQLNFGVKIGDN